MILYHGSNTEVITPQLIKTNRKLDFGAGFYLTSSLKQARRWAELTTQRRNSGTPIVSMYEIDMKIYNTLSIKTFNNANEDWLNFVVANRLAKHESNDFDIISGPVANDQTIPVLTLYMSNFMNAQTAIEQLLTQKLTDQFALKTIKALHAITFKGVNHEL